MIMGQKFQLSLPSSIMGLKNTTVKISERIIMFKAATWHVVKPFSSVSGRSFIYVVIYQNILFLFFSHHFKFTVFFFSVFLPFFALPD